MSENQVYAITGANRGIGLGLVLAYLAKPTTTVVGIVRSEDAAASLLASSEAITSGKNSALHIALIPETAQSSPDSFRAALLASIPPTITKVHTLICSAGWSPPMVPTLSTTASDLQACFTINTILPLVALQAMHHLLAPGAKFIVLSSSVGSIGGMEPMPGAPYGPSKAALNWIIRSLHVQREELVCVALHPGWVRTRMGEQAAKDWGYEPGPPLSVEDSVSGVVRVVEEASRERFGGKFVTQTGDEIPW